MPPRAARPVPVFTVQLYYPYYRSGAARGVSALTGGQKHVAQAAEFWVFCADFNRHLQICPDAQLGLAEQLLLGVVDTAMMGQNALTAAESLGLGGVYIGGIRNNIESVTELLKLPKHVLPLFGLCLGWPADNPDLKPRLPAELVVHENQYQPLDEKLLARYDEQLAEYYLTRGSNTRRDTERSYPPHPD